MLTLEGQSMRERLVVSSICMLIALIGVAIAGWAIVSGQIWAQGVEGLFLIIISLVVALFFAITPIMEIRRGLFKGNQPKSSQEKDKK